MSDPRLTPDAEMMSEQTAGHVLSPTVDLCRSPDGPRDRQLVMGDGVTILGRRAGWAYVQSTKDSYCGFVPADRVGQASAPTHKVIARATHAYEGADFKSPDRFGLSFASHVTVTAQDARFSATPLGHVPNAHLGPIDQMQDDPAAVAAVFLGTPYLWGGNSCWGIDCSGLVQAALLACGIPCPGDSDMQMALGTDATGPYQRNDLLFWKGHVALVSDTDTLIHANAAAMSTTYEPIKDAIARIKAQGDGPVTAHRRL